MKFPFVIFSIFFCCCAFFVKYEDVESRNKYFNNIKFNHVQDMYRSKDFILRSRFNNNDFLARETNKNIDQENEKPER